MLTTKLASSRRKRLIALFTVPPTCALLGAVLWEATVLASDVPKWLISVFWLTTMALIGLWEMADVRRQAKVAINRLESAIRLNSAEDFKITAEHFIEFEEVDDEGACYAFELADSRVVFISGQEFYEPARFPNTDFSLVYMRSEAGDLVDLLIRKRGEKLLPQRTVAANVAAGLSMPGHLEIIPGSLEGLEQRLAV